mmetsp:Transcript_38326/g.97070  ORF Transcript_38326/g.97070 Transcript_38326/m.97070 type:complete len:244 (+) Transcript_38326:390-1121(+)
MASAGGGSAAMRSERLRRCSLLGGAAVGDGEQHDGLAGLEQRRVHNVVALALQLDDVALLQRPHVGVAQRSGLELRLGVDQVLEVVLLLGLGLGDEVAKVLQLQVHQVGDVRQPGELQLGLLEVARRVELALQAAHGAVARLVDFPDEAVAPVHERHLLALLHRLRVHLLQPQGGRLGGGLVARCRVLLVARHDDHLRLARPIGEPERHAGCRGNGGVARAHGVDDALVDGPDLVPLLQGHIL